MIQLRIVNESGFPVRRAPLARAARACAAATSFRFRLAVALVDGRRIRALHRRFLGGPPLTDVLAFPMERRGRLVEGEIALCVTVARREAARRNHSFHAELALYLVHGMLHLAGEDDRTSAHRARMWRKQSAILAAVGWRLRS